MPETLTLGPVSPAVQLRARLQEARVEGMEFEEAWPWAFKRVKWPHDTTHRVEWKAVLGDPASAQRVGMAPGQAAKQVRAWRACYLREPITAREAPLQRLEMVA